MRRRRQVDPGYDPHFHRTSAAYDVLGERILAESRGWTDWPELGRYDAWTEDLCDLSGRSLRFAEVERSRVVAAGGYDVFIETTGLIPTRPRNWHDFFNACIWARFPRMKLRTLARSVGERRAHQQTKRSPLSDWLTHFDECGLVVRTHEPELLAMIRQLRWRELFVEQRRLLERSARVTCFGHATLEGLREPHLGLMGKALLWHDPDFDPDRDPDGDFLALDAWLEARLQPGPPPRLHPVPVLGLPGWYGPNQSPSFYDNPDYFRERARSQLSDLAPRDQQLSGSDLR
jgi:DUF3025 family protein